MKKFYIIRGIVAVILFIFFMWGLVLVMNNDAPQTETTETTETPELTTAGFTEEIKPTIEFIGEEVDELDIEKEEIADTPIAQEMEIVEEPEPTCLGTFRLTAYCPCSKCCGHNTGITATGTTATQGRTIAVNPNQIPYGSVVIINGHEYIAEDCGGGIGWNCIDIYFDSHEEAIIFGQQYTEIYISERS